MGNIVLQVFSGKCPNCKKDKVFKKGAGIAFLTIPTMKNACANCNYLFMKEPGFFTGAMYVSYGLAIIELAISFIVANLFFSDNLVLVIMIAVIVLLSTTNFRYSRLLWIYFFYQVTSD